MSEPVKVGDLLGYSCAYCGELFTSYDDPSVIRCCGEVGHVEPEYEAIETPPAQGEI